MLAAVLRVRDFKSIPDLGSITAPKEGNKFFCPTVFCSHKYHKIVNNFIFEQLKLSKRWVWDPGSEIRYLEKTYSGTRI
jgi:hypothetical protein